MVKNRAKFFIIVLTFLMLIISCKIDPQKKINTEVKTVTSSENTIAKKEIFRNQNSEEEIKQMLKAFYTEYINGIEYKGRKEIEEIKNKYLTSNILDKIESAELDYDPIINAQDVDLKWIENLEIAKKSENYSVCYPAYSGGKNCIILSVIRDKNDYKIDDIEF